MDVKALYQEAFGDDDAFTEFFLHRDNMHTLTLCQDGELIAVAFLVERQLQNGSKGQKTLPVGIVSGVCVQKSLRGKGYGAQMMKQVEERARELGLCALYLCPDVPKFYQKLGYRNVTLCTTYRVTQPRLQPKRSHYRAIPFDGDLCNLQNPSLQTLMQFFASVQANCAQFTFCEADVVRVCDELRVAGGGWLVWDKKGICALCMSDGKTLTRIFARKNVKVQRMLSRALREDGSPAFARYNFRVLTSMKKTFDPLVSRIYLQELALDPSALQAFLGSNPTYAIIECY